MSRTRRDEAVIATKFSFNAQPGNPTPVAMPQEYPSAHSTIVAAIEDRLRDFTSSSLGSRDAVEEVMTTLNDLVRSGKVRHIGFSNVPAWYAARARRSLTNADTNDLRCFNSSTRSSRASRTRTPCRSRRKPAFRFAVESLASGFLTGKYQRVDGRLSVRARV